jgi:ATP-dependent Lhr-like helicase
VLAREAEWLPSWREIVLCCRRLEARGEIRGGRFIAGLAGEQYADPTAVGLLREGRRRPPARQFVAVSGADPLNLVGILTPGGRLPSLTGNRLLYLDGLPIASYAGGEVTYLEALDPKEQWEARNALLRRGAAAVLGVDAET